MDTIKTISRHMQRLGAKGGAAGRGAAKRRSPEHYVMLAEARRKALAAKRAAREMQGQ